ncbi:hypothetical protein GGS24DRAFT_382259 [Hypoxylon argillaceum]|nr:hypothetical protein GGS24DRAFT_382259 [Hypoxylon argillaceum]
MDLQLEQRIASAIAAVEKGQSVRATAKLYQIPRSTLASRLHGSVSRQQSQEINQLFSFDIEVQIVEWIYHSESAGRIPYR